MIWYRRSLGRRHEERERLVRMRRLLGAGLVPLADLPIELPAEMVDLATGRLVDRRRRQRTRARG